MEFSKETSSKIKRAKYKRNIKKEGGYKMLRKKRIQ